MTFRPPFSLSGLSLWAAPAFSQACSMCYSTGKSDFQGWTAGHQQRRCRSPGSLLVSATLGVWMAFRYGRRRDSEQECHLN